MAKSFKVMIVTPDKTAFEGEAVSAIIPGLAGYLGVWANHAPLVGAVAPGVVFLRLDDSGSEKHFAVGTGFVEISDNVVNVMTDTCELANEIDITRARMLWTGHVVVLRAWNLIWTGNGPDYLQTGPKLASRPAKKAESALSLLWIQACVQPLLSTGFFFERIL